MEKLKIKEAIVVEGRDDTAVLKQVTDALIIETHGFGIAKTTWELLEKAYKENGLPIEVHIKKDCAHHPHGLDEPNVIVDFIKKYC